MSCPLFAVPSDEMPFNAFSLVLYLGFVPLLSLWSIATFLIITFAKLFVAKMSPMMPDHPLLSCDSDPPAQSTRFKSILSKLGFIFNRRRKAVLDPARDLAAHGFEDLSSAAAKRADHNGYEEQVACKRAYHGVEYLRPPSQTKDAARKGEDERLELNNDERTSGPPRISRFSWQALAAGLDEWSSREQSFAITVSQLESLIRIRSLLPRTSLSPVLVFPAATSTFNKLDGVQERPGKVRKLSQPINEPRTQSKPFKASPLRSPEGWEPLDSIKGGANESSLVAIEIDKQLPIVASESFPHAVNHKHASEPIAGVPNASDGSSSNLSGFVCNVQWTTGKEPPPLVGASTTVVGDKLYVFGGRRLSRRRPYMINHLYELDLIKRHWSRLVTQGQVPSARYFHSTCALGDSKLVCYGGMAPTSRSAVQDSPEQSEPSRNEQGTMVMSDIHIYDIPTAKWSFVATNEAPPGRYAHCAAILPSSGVFTSIDAPRSAIRNNPASNPNQGSLGVTIDGQGGAEMIIVGGQDSLNRYIETVNVFNLRSLTWTSTTPLGKSCGAYRSVVTTVPGLSASQLGANAKKGSGSTQDHDVEAQNIGDESSILIYSNYNFTDVKLELQVRTSEGSLVEKRTGGTHSPPGLRFPNGGVIDNHFIVSGTYLTSSKQEYLVWALDLINLTWSRVDVGGNTFSTGSWNRGVVWNKRNAFVALGDRKRSLAEDYNQRRLNFKNFCVIELEAFGLHESPNANGAAALASAHTSLAQSRRESSFDASAQLGMMALMSRDLSDMEILAIGGERIPVSSMVLARRWGPYFTHLMQSTLVKPEANSDGSTLTVTNMNKAASRNSLVTIAPSIHTIASTTSNATTVTITPSNVGTISNSDGSSTLQGTAPPSVTSSKATDVLFSDPKQGIAAAPYRSRLLFLPHTQYTIRALLHYLYTGSLAPAGSELCTPQILCSLLQLARPYHIDGLLEATVSRLHHILDVRNTPAIFNAAAMAAGGGDTVRFEDDYYVPTSAASTGPGVRSGASNSKLDEESSEEESASSAPSTETSDAEGVGGSLARERAATAISSSEMLRPAWTGGWSTVVGLQKRGLRGLLEGRKLRERTTKGDEGPGTGGSHAADGVGLGIA